MKPISTLVRRFVAAIIGATVSVLALSGTAFAYTEPIGPLIAVRKPGGSAVADTVAATPAPINSGWSLTAVLAAVLFALLVGWSAHVALKYVRGGRRTPATA